MPPSTDICTLSPPLPIGFPKASRAVITASIRQSQEKKPHPTKVTLMVAVLTSGLTGPGATALENGEPVSATPETRIVTRSVPATSGVYVAVYRPLPRSVAATPPTLLAPAIEIAIAPAPPAVGLPEASFN